MIEVKKYVLAFLATLVVGVVAVATVAGVCTVAYLAATYPNIVMSITGLLGFAFAVHLVKEEYFK